QPVQQVQQAERIRPARHPDGQRLAGMEQPMTLQRALDLEQQIHGRIVARLARIVVLPPYLRRPRDGWRLFARAAKFDLIFIVF
ncbi:MAG TPA: hypothetical protein PK170_05420, partial [Anaerolineae bacterium]|nr:hypothetical protein [Anaerolineae bacterium]